MAELLDGIHGLVPVRVVGMLDALEGNPVTVYRQKNTESGRAEKLKLTVFRLLRVLRAPVFKKLPISPGNLTQKCEIGPLMPDFYPQAKNINKLRATYPL